MFNFNLFRAVITPSNTISLFILIFSSLSFAAQSFSQKANKSQYTKNNEAEDVYPLARFVTQMGRGQGLPGGFMVDTLAFIDSNGRVAVMGFKKSGIGGNGGGNSDDRNKNPLPLTHVSNIEHAVEVTGGIYHLLALDVNGDVWGWGQSGYHETGCEGGYVWKPCRVLSNAIAIGAGEYHSMALTADGIVYTWGHNTSGQLGKGVEDDNVLIPIAVNRQILVCGSKDASSGKIIQCDKNEKGKKIFVMDNEKARLIGSAYEGGFAVTINGQSGNSRVWGWGDSEGDVFDRNEGCGRKRILIPTHIKSLDDYASKIVYIGGGNSYAAALLDDGRVIAWGRHKAIAQTGNNKEGSCSSKPITLLTNIKQLQARFLGAIALSNDHKIYTWGEGSNSAMNIYGKTVTERPTTSGKIPMYISAGKEHIYYVTADGSVYGAGYNAQGQVDPNQKGHSIEFPGSYLPLDEWLKEAR